MENGWNLIMSEQKDMVHHPPHYTFGKYEVWDIIYRLGLNFFLGNVVKYVARWDKKGDPTENLKKAHQYLEKFISIYKTDPTYGKTVSRAMSIIELEAVLDDWNLPDELRAVIRQIGVWDLSIEIHPLMILISAEAILGYFIRERIKV